MGKYLKDLNDKLTVTHPGDYYRYQYQSFMTGPEWRNVEMAEEFAQSLQENHSYFSFPFFGQILGLWRVFWKSYQAARQYDSFWQVFTSEYMLMDLFVSIFTTLEMLPKGLMSLFLWPFLDKNNPTEMQQHLANFAHKYAADLQTIPFYDHDYEAMRKSLSSQYKQCQSISWVDWWSWTYVSIELRARKWISKPLQWIYSEVPEVQEGEEAAPITQVPPVTDVIVKLKLEGLVDEATAKQTMADKLKLIEDVHVVHDLSHAHIYVKALKDHDTHTNVYACVRTPRYKQFIEVVRDLKGQDIQLRLIAGQKQVQVKVEVQGDVNQPDSLTQRIESVTTNSTTQKLYAYGDCLHANRKILMFNAPVKNLGETVEKLGQTEGTHVSFIHNF